MAKAKVVEKKVRMGQRDIIKYQLLTECFIKNILLSQSELSCLTLLGAFGEHELADFCASAVEEGIFKTSQTVRNFLNKAAKSGLIIKKGSNRKKILLDPSLNIQTSGTIILDYKLVYVTKEQ